MTPPPAVFDNALKGSPEAKRVFGLTFSTCQQWFKLLVGDPPNIVSAIEARAEIKPLCEWLGEHISIPEIDDLKLRQGLWEAYLSGSVLTLGGVTAATVGEQLDHLRLTDNLLSQMAFAPHLATADQDAIARQLYEAVEQALLQFWWLFSDKDRNGSVVSDWLERGRRTVDCATQVASTVAELATAYPLPEFPDRDEALAAWQCDIYHYVLKLINYQPVS